MAFDKLPAFSKVDPAEHLAQVEGLLDHNLIQLDELLKTSETFSWHNLMLPIEEMDDAIHHLCTPISHLHAVVDNEALRKAYNDSLPALIAYGTKVSQNEDLFRAVESIYLSQEFNTLSAAKKKTIENNLRDFKLAGVNLPQDKKVIYAELLNKLSKATTKFSENVLDATNAYFLNITDETKIDGLPNYAIEAAREHAAKRNLSGYVFTLDYPSFSTAMKYLKDRELRATLYKAYTTRASSLGEHPEKWDNKPLMHTIMQQRLALANLLDFDNYASYSLATKMAKTPSEVLHFLQDLLEKSKSFAVTEYQAVCELAKKMDNIDVLAAWDMAYYSEKLSEATFEFNQEEVRPYFPINHVMSGLFKVVEQLFGLQITERKDVDVWHRDVKFFEIHDDKQKLRAAFYIDLYARPHKREGAWMDDCQSRRMRQDNSLQLPIAFLTCNFMPPVGDAPALLTHDDVTTLFHEFGHCLHHMLTKVDVGSVAGINGVPWDAVEFPSQFMENFCWEKISLGLIAAHYQTGEALPDTLLQKMLAAKHFQTGLQMVRQLEFAIFDFRLHVEYNNQPEQIDRILKEVRAQTSVIPVPEFNRFENTFSHVFSGGYAAGYYSYKWAEVLACDAYGQFLEHGVLSSETGRSFMQTILEVGGVPEPMDAFIAFRGRPPTVDALLEQSGILVR